MSALYLLLLLSQNGAGDINASFVNSDSLDACRQSMQLVESIFASRRIPLLYKGCMPSSLRFTLFAHSDTTQVTRYHYLIGVGGDSFTITPMDRETCLAQARQRGGEGVYCASSIQRLLE
ncbi:MAG: hypothetical protein P8178_12695 [Candidatus Thiodiazotropha sp.]